MSNFVVNKYRQRIMLGFDTFREPIKDPFASQIRDVVRRISTGELNEYDNKVIEESKQRGSTYEVVWE